MKVSQLCPTLCDPWTVCSPWNSPGQNTGLGSLSFSSRSSQQGMELGSSALQVNSLPTKNVYSDVIKQKIKEEENS